MPETDLTTTLAVWRPSRQWTTLFHHDPYAPALWALLFEPDETLLASAHFGEEWPRLSSEAVVADHAVGFQTSAGQARERLVARLEPVRRFPEAWRAFSLTRALALALAGLPATWPLRFEASRVTMAYGSRAVELMAAAITAATDLARQPPQRESEAHRLLLAMAHGMSPETPLQPPRDDSSLRLPWPSDPKEVGYALLGQPVDCPTSHVEQMTRARRQWEASW